MPDIKADIKTYSNLKVLSQILQKEIFFKERFTYFHLKIKRYNTTERSSIAGSPPSWQQQSCFWGSHVGVDAQHLSHLLPSRYIRWIESRADGTRISTHMGCH